MLNGYHILTLTHRHAPLESIGKAIVRSEEPAPAMQLLKARFGWDELLYLATCNRVVYLFYTHQPVASDLAAELLGTLRPDLNADAIAGIAPKMRLLHGADAIRHLLEVAASMDSLVIGEREILRQLRDAYDRCRDWRLTGDHLRLLMRFTIETAKDVYASTGIGEKALSVVALAFQRMLDTGLRPNARILLVGAGRTNALVAKFLFKYGFRNVAVFNRTLAKAQAIAEYLEGIALPINALEYYTEGFDALIVCTGATEPVITPALYQQLLAGEPDTKTVVDLSVPNNVDQGVLRHFPVHYIQIEDLRETARENLTHREQERRKAELLISDKVRAYRELWHQRQVERALFPVVQEIRTYKERALGTVFSKELSALDPAARDLVQQMMDYLEEKSVASAMRTMKEVAANAGRQMAAAPKEIPGMR